MSSRPLSYSQRLEDLYLLRCFGEQKQGSYIDVGSGHPVYDNVSFAFYLRGWSGITVEPNPRLARLSRAVRPRDRSHEAVVGRQVGQASFYLVHDYHGFSTTIGANAQSALAEFGKTSDAITVPATTLAALCEEAAPPLIDFLKVDVEGAEADVLFSGDWSRFRPKVILVEALAPYTLAPAWGEFEPFLEGHGYRYVWFDSLNRYYLAREAEELAPCFNQASIPMEDVKLFRDAGPAMENASHPDHGLSLLLARAAMTQLPLLEPALLLDLLTADISTVELARSATHADRAQICARLFGARSDLAQASESGLANGLTLHALYAEIIDSDAFRAACGRISASYSW